MDIMVQQAVMNHPPQIEREAINGLSFVRDFYQVAVTEMD